MQTDGLHSDQFLASQLQKGNIEAFETIYHRYKKRLYYYAFDYLKNQQECEEIIQNTFISLWENRSNIDITKSIKSYLFRITVNQVLNFLKHRVVEKQYADSYLTEVADTDFSTQKEIYYNDLKNYVDKIVDKLPEQQQRVFKMSRWGGASNEDIAQKLGISIRTAENLLYRASKFVKENLTDERIVLLIILSCSVFGSKNYF